jgi:hypothetical protein
MITSPSIWHLPRETKEWIGPITVTANGVIITSWQVCLIADGSRPVEADWQTPDSIGPYLGVTIGTGSNYPSLATGSYLIWVRFDNATEEPVINDVGIVVIE